MKLTNYKYLVNLPRLPRRRARPSHAPPPGEATRSEGRGAVGGLFSGSTPRAPRRRLPSRAGLAFCPLIKGAFYLIIINNLLTIINTLLTITNNLLALITIIYIY